MVNEEVSIGKIKCIHNRKMGSVIKLAESIEKAGLIQKIVVCKLENDSEGFEYEVMAGRRRFVALVGHLKLKTLNFEDHMNLMEGDIDLISYVENVERENLTLWEQVDSLIVLKAKYNSVVELAKVFNQSEQWIRLRIRLGTLVPVWKEHIKEDHDWSIAMYEEITRFSPELQKSYYKDWQIRQSSTLKSLTRKLRAKLTLLKDVPWNIEKKLGKFKACSKCNKRSSTGEFFFEGFTDIKDDQCLDKDCFQEHLKMAFLIKVESLMKDNTLLYILSRDYYSSYDDEIISENEIPKGCKALNGSEFEKASKKDSTGMIGIYRSPLSKAGEVINIKINKTIGPTGRLPGTPTTLAERKANKTKQRKRKAIVELIEFLENFKREIPYTLPSDEEFFRYIVLLGVNNHTSFSNQPKPIDLSTEHGLNGMKKIEKKTISELKPAIWRSLCSNIIESINYGQTGGIECRWKESLRLAKIVDFDLEAVYKEKIKEYPDPKSWIALAKQEKKAKEAQESKK